MRSGSRYVCKRKRRRRDQLEVGSGTSGSGAGKKIKKAEKQGTGRTTLIYVERHRWKPSTVSGPPTRLYGDSCRGPYRRSSLGTDGRGYDAGGGGGGACLFEGGGS